jgi:hypothetical protein
VAHTPLFLTTISAVRFLSQSAFLHLPKEYWSFTTRHLHFRQHVYLQGLVFLIVCLLFIYLFGFLSGMPYCYDLYPSSSNNVCGRSGFLIHGGGCSGNPSEGCIVIESESTRYLIRSGATLHVQN